MRKAVVIVPTYNERDNIVPAAHALLEVFETIDGWVMEILVVDDNSPDLTHELVEDLSREDGTVHLLLNEDKKGLGAAYLRGMATAFGPMKADVVFEFDADLSHDPEKIPAFLTAIDQGADLVLGSRYIKGGSIPRDWGLHRKLLSWGGNAFMTLAFMSRKVHDWTTGYRAIRRQVYESVLPHMANGQFSGYTFQIGFLHETLRHGFRVVEVPFHFVDRTCGESKLGPEYIINTLSFVSKVRLLDLTQWRFFRFGVVGSIGALVQLIALNVWWRILPYQIAFFLAVETAVVSNFILNNLWTFSDRRLPAGYIPRKFLQFNAASGASIGIQQVTAIVGQFGIGLFYLFTPPLLPFRVNTGHIYAVVGIALGMAWNFYFYNRYVWREQRHAPSHDDTSADA